MIRLGVFYVPRNAEGDFVKMESNFNKGVVVEPAPFPDIHSTREYHLIKRLARAHSLDLGVTWGAYHEDPRLNGDTFVIEGPGGYFDTSVGTFSSEINVSSLFNAWDLDGEVRGGAPGWVRLLPLLQRTQAEMVTGAGLKRVALETLKSASVRAHTVLEVDIFEPETTMTLEPDRIHEFSQVDVVVGVRRHDADGEGGLTEVRRFSPYIPDQVEDVQVTIQCTYPGAKWLTEFPSNDAGFAPR